MPYCDAMAGPCYTFRPVPSKTGFREGWDEKRVANAEGRWSREVGLSQNAVVLIVVFESTSAFGLAKSVLLTRWVISSV